MGEWDSDDDVNFEADMAFGSAHAKQFALVAAVVGAPYGYFQGGIGGIMLWMIVGPLLGAAFAYVLPSLFRKVAFFLILGLGIAAILAVFAALAWLITSLWG